jgi:hypothetical protein
MRRLGVMPPVIYVERDRRVEQEIAVHHWWLG